MSKTVSAAISIFLLFAVDRAAMHWKRIHGEDRADERKSGLIHSNETRRALGPQNVLSSNLMTNDIVETGKL